MEKWIPVNDVSVLVGGKAGDGINSAGLTVAHLLNRLGYRMYMYFDYPSLIKGGHNFAIVRASEGKIGAHRTGVDFILALNQDTIRFHEGRTHSGTVVIYDADNVKTDGTGVKVREILSAENAPPIMGNSCIIGAFARASGIGWEIVEQVFRAHFPKGTDKNLAVARRAFDMAGVKREIPGLAQSPLPVVTGNEAIGLGLLHAGLDAFVAYPMTPTSNLLHFLAEVSPETGLFVIHPENEIAVILMALGFAYSGKKTAVGTSGGGFCLMTEGLSFSGQAELPVVIVLGQRTGPSTGLPTYTAQSDLHFALHAGQGEFPRFVVAPGDTEEAFAWASVAVRVAWKYQVPAILLCDKTLCEGSYSFDISAAKPPDIPVPEGEPVVPYRRYEDTPGGISPLLFPGAADAVVKVNSYAHDESGISTEDPGMVERMTEKRKKKLQGLASDVAGLPAVARRGKTGAKTALLCWGSTGGVCAEVAGNLGLALVRPIVMEPFPVDRFEDAIQGIDRLIAVEENSLSQLSMLVRRYGFDVSGTVLRYDGRPFTVEELDERVRRAIS
ncbi:MAG: 2-oxoacid:acceptor oxidoreductase subunit alpha [Methanoregulaceae archaeon]|nr:2-oxoacid:acceptor oxidoreductase subunit alpha [Methanoregulaceae archaeon]